MKRSKLFLACTAGFLTMEGIASAKMHKFFIGKKATFFPKCSQRIVYYSGPYVYANPQRCYRKLSVYEI